MRNTIRNVTMVVPVLITSCHVSENPKSGPLTAHTRTMPAAVMNVDARPAASEVLLASSPKNFEIPEDSLAFSVPFMDSSPLCQPAGKFGTAPASSLSVHLLIIAADGARRCNL